MGVDLKLSSALQRRLVDALLDVHPLPWRLEADTTLQAWLVEVVDANRNLVLKCATEPEAVELIEAALTLSNANARTEIDLDRTMRYEEHAAIKPKTASDLFDKLMPIALTKHAEKARAIGAVFAFEIEGDAWLVDCTSTPPICARQLKSDQAMCTFVVDEKHIPELIDGQNGPLRLYFQGKLVVKGDAMLLMKLPTLFELATSP